MSDTNYNPNPMAYVGNQLDRTGNNRLNEDWVHARLADPRTHFLPIWRLQPLVRGGETKSAAWVSLDVAKQYLKDALIVHLGQIGEVAHFSFDVSHLEPEDAQKRFAEHGDFADLWTIHAHVPPGAAAILATARAVTDWNRRHGFCAVCGKPTLMKDAGFRRICSNEECNSQHFPRTDPVVIMLISKGDKCLLGRQERFPPGWFSTLAGFIEPGETVEEAVRREVMEETAVRVGDVSYKFSQPWPFPSSLMIGCVGEALSEDIEVDFHELADAQWFDRATVLAALNGEEDAGLRVPPSLAVAHHLIAYWATH